MELDQQRPQLPLLGAAARGAFLEQACELHDHRLELAAGRRAHSVGIRRASFRRGAR
jgi:hypothetical protein